MISEGRYGYHLADIAEIKAKPLPLNPIDSMNLERMLREVAEYEDVNGIPRTHPKQEAIPHADLRIGASQVAPAQLRCEHGVVPPGTRCKHGNTNFCGFCFAGTNHP